MKIAISTDGNYVSNHFGRCPSFTILEIEGNKLVRKDLIDNPGHHPGFLPEFLRQKGIQYIIAGGMGQRAQVLFADAGIETIMGITGELEEVINKILNGTLEGGESLCNPGSGKGYGVERTDAVIGGKKYIGGREHQKEDTEALDNLKKQAQSLKQQLKKVDEQIDKLNDSKE